MVHRLIAVATIGVLAGGIASCGGDSGGDSKKLAIYAWAGEIPDSVIEAFEKETGIDVTVDSFDSNETMIAKLAAGNSGYDVVEPSQYAVQQLVSQELIKELDYDKIEGFDQIAAKFVNPEYDPGNAHAIPWVWGTTGMMYNLDCTGGEELTSWQALFDEKYKGKIYMLDNMLAAYIVGTQILGLSAATRDEADIAAATDKLIAQKPLLGGYNSSNYFELVDSGDACVAEAWGGTSVAAVLRENPQVRYVIPEEGGTLWTDNVSIAAGTKNEENAYKFLNFLLKPEIAAMATDDASLATPNDAALPLIKDTSMVSNPSIYPDPETLAKTEFIVDPGEALRYFQEGWTKVKAA
jgi:spermidine/putrescine transport system substrate-binding protein